MNKEDLLAFIKTKQHAVISTVASDGCPEAALIGFGETDDFELIFGTYTTSRKYANLKHNNNVAFVIGWDEEAITVQYEGIASELAHEEWEHYLALYHKKVPSAVVFKSHPDQSYWKVTPRFVRYSDFSGEHPAVVEFTF
jgi:pyridoxine/pyridoxamine 5'-phosphate oxidase